MLGWYISGHRFISFTGKSECCLQKNHQLHSWARPDLLFLFFQVTKSWWIASEPSVIHPKPAFSFRCPGPWWDLPMVAPRWQLNVFWQLDENQTKIHWKSFGLIWINPQFSLSFQVRLCLLLAHEIGFVTPTLRETLHQLNVAGLHWLALVHQRTLHNPEMSVKSFLSSWRCLFIHSVTYYVWMCTVCLQLFGTADFISKHTVHLNCEHV